MKYLGITLIKYVQNSYKKTLLKEIKDDFNKWRHTSFSLVRRLNIVKIPNLPPTAHN